MSTSNETLSLIHDGDSYTLELEVSHHIRLRQILRYESNDASRIPTHEQWFDLTPDAREAILKQIRRRHKEQLIKV